jgi:hypothetical protein
MNENQETVRWPRPVLVLLIAGILLRLVAVHQPLIDAHEVRQCQTADTTRSLIQQPGWHVSSIASWRGDLNARLLLELPVYNYLVMGVHSVIGHLDASGKLVSVALWAVSFVILQGIWRRTLSSRQAFWANALFVFAPLSIFFGQAFMPEMLIQLLGFGFLLGILRYMEQPTWGRLSVAGLTGLVGMMVKTPEIVHLYGIAFLLLLAKDGWQVFRRVEYWAILAVTILCVKWWSGVVNEVNREHFPDWTASVVLREFLGSLKGRLDLGLYRRVAGYLACFILTPPGVALAVLGAVRVWKDRAPRLALYWLASVAGFYLLWGVATAGIHSYYNLPAIGPCAMFFGIGMVAMLDWAGSRSALGWLARFPRATPAAVIAPFILLGTLYLFRQDRVLYESALWLKAHTAPEDIVLVKSNHRAHTINYFQLPTFPYYAERRIWCYTIYLPEAEKQRARQICKYALVTSPPRETGWLERWRLKVKHDYVEPEKLEWLEKEGGFHRIYSNSTFTVYEKARDLW